MIYSEKALTQSFRLSKRVRVDITVGPNGAVCEWDPARPATLTTKELRRYRAARDSMLRRLADVIGGRVLLVEV